MNSFFLIIMLLFSINLFAQKDLRDLYDKREYEKCISKTNKLLNKEPNNLDILFLKSLCYFEMAQAPQNYAHFEENPLQECLKIISKIRTRDVDESFAKSRKDTLYIIKDFAEQYADELISKSKIRAVRMYRYIYKAFESDFNTLQLVEIYFKTEDYDKGVIEIDKLYNFQPANIDEQSGETILAMKNAPMFLIKYGMLSDAYQLSEKYVEKFKDNSVIYNALKQSALYLIDTLYSSSDKMMFMEFSKEIRRIYSLDREVQKHIYNQYMQMLTDAEKRFTEIENPQSWRDTIYLRDFFKYADMCKSVMPSNDFYEYEQRVSAEHRLDLPFEKRKIFSEKASSIINKHRTSGVKCNMGYVGDTDSVLWHDELAHIAQQHAKDMYAYNYASHTDRKQGDAKARIDDSSLKGYKVNTFSGVQFMGTLKLGEAIITGNSWHNVYTNEDIENAIRIFFDKIIESKDGYCEIMMDYEFSHIGIGVFGDRWVLMMARILVINE